MLLSACTQKETKVATFRKGTFKTHLDGTDITSVAIRNDSIQYENYNSKIDTFSIKWISNFEYELLNLHPKNALDSTLFVVKITGIKEKSYTFTAHYKGSNFKQKGSAIKIKD